MCARFFRLCLVIVVVVTRGRPRHTVARRGRDAPLARLDRRLRLLSPRQCARAPIAVCRLAARCVVGVRVLDLGGTTADRGRQPIAKICGGGGGFFQGKVWRQGARGRAAKIGRRAQQSATNQAVLCASLAPNAIGAAPESGRHIAICVRGGGGQGQGDRSGRRRRRRSARLHAPHSAAVSAPSHCRSARRFESSFFVQPHTLFSRRSCLVAFLC